MPRLFRESPLNSIWEGSGNVIALDVLRALAREPAAGEAVLAEVDAAAGGDTRLDAAAKQLRADLAAGPAEADGRAVAARLSRSAPPAVPHRTRRSTAGRRNAVATPRIGRRNPLRRG